jgi:hypothetical protein
MKIHAKHAAPYREIEGGPLLFPVEYTFTAIERQSDSVALSPTNWANETHLMYLLKQALLTHLRAKYAPEQFSTSDVVMF